MTLVKYLRGIILVLSGNKHATIVSTYAPAMTNTDEVKDKFYNDLDDVISATPRTDKLILLGDFNARVGTDYQTWEGVAMSALSVVFSVFVLSFHHRGAFTRGPPQWIKTLTKCINGALWWSSIQ